MVYEFIFEVAPFASCHASTIVETPHGMVTAWFGGSKEGRSDVGIWLSRYEEGHWTTPTEVAVGHKYDGSRVACYNPVLCQVPGASILLFYKEGTHPSIWKGLVMASKDGGRSWSNPAPLPEGFIGPDKNKPLICPDGSVLWGTSTETNVWRIHFEKMEANLSTFTKTACVRPEGQIDAIQPSLLSLGGERLIALGRTRQGWMFEVKSLDLGATWGTMRLIGIPNPNSGTDGLTLHDGRQLLVYNHSFRERRPLVVAISLDNSCWNVVAILEQGSGSYSYPACIQAADGSVHVTYTWNRQLIKHVILYSEDLVS